MRIIKITSDLLAAFQPYLTCEAITGIQENNPLLSAYGAVTDDQKTCGAIAAAVDQNQVVIFSLYVDSSIRRQGVATLLTDKIKADYGSAEIRAVWFSPEETFTQLKAFFASQNFTVVDREEDVYCFHSSLMREVPTVRRAFLPTFHRDSNIIPLNELSPTQINELLDDTTIDDRLSLDAVADRLTPEISFCYCYNGQIKAYFLCGLEDGKNATVLAAVSRKGAHPNAFLQLVAASANAAYRLLNDDFYIFVNAIDSNALDFIKLYSNHKLTALHNGIATLNKDVS